jgi:hypothetical protein
MTSHDETEVRLSVLAHLAHALKEAKKLPDQEYTVYLIEMARIEVGPVHQDDRAPVRKAN